MLSREEIEEILDDAQTCEENEGYKSHIPKVRSAIAALSDSLDLANEEIKHAYNDNETHRRRISELETENERLKNCESPWANGLCTIAQAKAYAEAENAKLREENERIKCMMPKTSGQLMDEILRLRAVVEAVDELMAWDNNALEDVDPVTGKPFLNPACEEYKVAVRKVLAALEKVEKPKENK